MRKLVYLTVVLCLVAAEAFAATITVPTDYATISAAVGAAVSGDTVNILAGTYADNVIINKSLSLIGAGAGVVKVYPAFSGPNTGGGSLPAGHSTIMLVQANNVLIEGMTLDGDNPGLTSGIVVNGADLDARNGIITNHPTGTFNGLEVRYVTVKNIYLRGIYASSGGTFNFHHCTVDNVAAEYASIGMFNFGGSGKFESNTVSNCNDAISSNWSTGTVYRNNNVTGSGSGVHTDNAGSSGVFADTIVGNNISNGVTNGYGIFVFSPYIPPVVKNNTITNMDVGLTCTGSYAAGGVTVKFLDNTVNGAGNPVATGFYLTTQIWGYASDTAMIEFSGNAITNCVDGFYAEAESGFLAKVVGSGNVISGNSNSGVVKGTGTLGAGTFNLAMVGNYWGATSGPLNASNNPSGAGNSIDNGTDYSPWWGADYRAVGHPWNWYANTSNGSTIQEAIGYATAGDAINLVSGVFRGGIDVNKRVSIIGVGSGADSLTNTHLMQSSPATAPTGAVVQLSASGTAGNPILFKNLRVRPVHLAGFNVPSGGISYVSMDNVQVIGTNEHNDTENEMGLRVATTASLNNLAITNCAFDHLTYGWYIFKHGDWGPGGSTMRYVNVSNSSFSYNDAKGVYAEKLSDASFTGCVVDNNGQNLAFYNKAWNGGFDINLKGMEPYANLSFTNMTVTNNGKFVQQGAGFMIKARSDGATYGTYPATLTGVAISGGSYTGNERGIRFGEPGKNNPGPTNVAIHGADICNNVQTYVGTDGSTYGNLVNATTAPINAEANYWCSVNYATILSHIGQAPGLVDFDPWCSDNTHTNCTLTNPPMVVWADDSWTGSAEGSVVGGHIFGYDAFATINTGLTAVGTGGTVNVLNGTYAEDLIIGKAVSLIGSGIDLANIVGPKTGANSATVRVSTSAGVVIKGFTITRDGNNVTDWNTNVKLTGLAIQGAAGNAEVAECKFTGNRTAIDLNFTSGNYIHNCVLDFNRSGLILRNQCTNNRFEENEVTNNWTVGILWLAASTEDATGTKFFNNKIEGNWYAQIENRSLTGGVKNFSGNWLGSTTLTTSNTNGSEPGYTAQIPVAYGGSAVNPGGALSVRGVGIGDMDYTPWLGSGLDANVNNGTGTVGFQGSFSQLYVDDDNAQSGSIVRIQEAVNLVSGSTIYLMPGTYAGQVVVSGFTGLNIIGSGVGTTFVTAPATAMTHYYTTGANNFAVISVENSDGINISKLTLDGFGKGNINSRFVGIGYFNAGGAVDSCEIKDVRNTPIDGGQHGVGFYAYNGSGPMRTIAVSHTHVVGFQKGAIVVNGPYATGNIAYCDIDGYGPASFNAMNGIQLGYSAAGSIVGNQVYGSSYTGSGWSATGILLQDATGPIVVKKNLVQECMVGIWYGNVGGQVDSNTVTATPAGTGLSYYWNIVVDPYRDHPTRQPMVSPFDGPVSGSRTSARAAAGTAAITTTATGNQLDGGGAGVGLEADAYSPEVFNFTATNNRATNFAYGIVMWEETGATLTGVLNGNDMLFNGYGFVNDGGTVNAQNNTFANTVNADDNIAGNYYNQNCWNDYSGTGPYAVGGTGANVDNNPNTDCGLDLTPDNIAYNCAGDFTVTVNIGEAVTALDAATVRLEFPSELNVAAVNSAYQVFAATQTSNPPGGKDTLRVDIGILTPNVIDGPATLFTVTMNGTTSVCTSNNISMIFRDLRDSTNTQIVVPLASASTFVADCVDPTFTVNSPVSGGYYNFAPVLNIGATDDCGLDAVYYQIDGCGATWTAIATGLGGTSYANAAWTLPGFAGLSEGSHCVRFKAKDDNGRGNADSCTYVWCFTKDVTPPAPPTAMLAKPGHNKVKLSWTNSPSSDAIGVKIQRVPWTDSPEYGSQPTPTSAPAYPANQLAGTTVLDTAASASSTTTHVDTYLLSNATRDIYYYGAFAYDAAGNYSVAAVSAEDRSTSYWLGDISNDGVSTANYDGKVYYEDLVIFSVTYGKKQTDPGYVNHADFGPTHNMSPKGIPLPDDSVNFEDLAIFAINFNAVTPTGKVAPLFANSEVDGPLGLTLTAEPRGDNVLYHLALANNAGNVKAVQAVLTMDNATLVGTELSESLQTTSELIFSKARVDGNTVTFDLALLGEDRPMLGSGELATFTVAAKQGDAPVVKLSSGQMRDLENQPLTVALNSSNAGLLPAVYELGQNYPNPFNPTTVIAYALPKAGQVNLEIYDLLGRHVTTLVDELQAAGRYSIEWNGTTANGDRVASGIYLYRLTSGAFIETRKMMLLK